MSDLPQPSIEQGAKIEKPAAPKLAESTKEAKSLGGAEQQIVNRIIKDGDEDKVLRDIAGVQSPDSDKTPKGSFQKILDDESAEDNRPVIGGEIISPTAVKVDDPRNPDGSINFRPSQERGWLSAVTSAYGRKDLPTQEMRGNVQAIVDAAKAAGVPRETIKAHLESLGIHPRDATQSSPAAEAQSSQQLHSSSELTNLPYDQIASKLPLDTQKPPRPEEIFPPMGGNMFDSKDNPTLAGRVTARVYNSLVERPNQPPPSRERSEARIAASKAGLQDYADYLTQQAEQRKVEGKPLFANGTTRPPGTDGFHVDGRTDYREHMYFFNKSKTHYKNAHEPEVRGYVTLSPTEATRIQRHFVDLATQMYDAGIDFTAKSASPGSMQGRTDNMVFYISASDQPRAAEMMKVFLAERGIGQGQVLAAQPSPQEGLSWALEPDDTQNKIWQEVSGSSEQGSFNSVVATMAMPTYLDRLAEAHSRLAQKDAADIYTKEAQRVRSIISKYKPLAEGSTQKQEPNQETKPADSTPAHRAIFEGVYDQMRQGAFGKTPEEQAERFIEDIADRAGRHIGEIQAANLTNEDIYREIWGKMSGYISRYNASSRFEEKKQDVSAVYLKLTGNINRLVKDGEVDPLTAKVYARYLERYKHIGGHHYNDIVRNNQELPEGSLQQKRPEYSRALGRLVSDYGEDAKEQESGGFIHFNGDKQTGDVTTRVYINPDLTQSPAQVIDAWDNALTQSGMKDKIYFKVPSGLSKRQEGIVMFITDQTKPEEVEKLLTAFQDSCPADLLSSTPMPSAVSVARGISMAPELRNINTFLKYSGIEKEEGVPEQISYNEWVASSTQLAFELAYNEATANGVTTITPKTLKDSAGGYFEKIAKLSGINPETMVPNSLGGELPSWAAKLAA